MVLLGPEFLRLNRLRFVTTRMSDINTIHFELVARSVVVAPIDEGVHLVGFGDCEENLKSYLTLQRACAFDEQDVAFGMDTYHVEWCGQEKSTYGGISRFMLRPNFVDIEFSPEASSRLGGVERLSISFRLALSEQKNLRRALECIFEGDGCLVTDSD